MNKGARMSSRFSLGTRDEPSRDQSETLGEVLEC